ncbi:tetraspanin-5 isoform X7 [Numida meleagris]|uniref:tetraspanin-5 isoform X7 n=1 Tax=Numida meleagris TaxID=8996 RepID=UPI000B3DF796|nr:tetraspanin-5 isoform X7 [Numida meleagris]
MYYWHKLLFAVWSYFVRRWCLFSNVEKNAIIFLCICLSQFLGIAFLGIGLWAWNEKGVLSNISSITDLGGFDPVWLFLVVGGVMFILGFAGCIGALRENTFLLKFFSVFLGIIFFLELTAGILAFVFKDWIKDQLYFFINNNIRAYRDDIDLQNLIDFTQEYWQCCGAFGADDWNLNIYFNCTDSNASRERCGVPFSCCTKDPAVIGVPHAAVAVGQYSCWSSHHSHFSDREVFRSCMSAGSSTKGV